MTAIPAEDVTYWYDQARRAFVAPGRPDLPLPTLAAAWDWSDSNLPWVYDTPADLTAGWPASTLVVDLADGSGDFYSRLAATVNAAPGRCVVRLPAGVHTLTSFRMAGTSGDPTYAFGFFFPKLQGLIGEGAGQTVVEMGPDSMSQAQLDRLAGMDYASFAPSQIAFCRIDGTATSPVLLSGITFRAADQQDLTAKAADVPIVIPQSAPHRGVTIYGGAAFIVSHCRFQAAGKGATSRPPFEHANLETGKSPSGLIRFCEFDGRRAPDLDPARTRSCGPIMLNSEISHTLTDSWLHHSNVSRYAANDQHTTNAPLSQTYRVTRCKAEQITNTKNDGRDGYTNATPYGWESTNARLQVRDCIISQDNPYTDRQTAQHLQITSVADVDPAGGRLEVYGGDFRNTGFPGLDGFLCVRATPSRWTTDGYQNTMYVYDSAGVRKTAYVVSGSWPPSRASLTAAGITPETHFLIRNG